MGQEVAAATDLSHPHHIHDLCFRGLIHRILRQVLNLCRFLPIGHLLTSDFRLVMTVLVADSLSACETRDWDDHVVVCVCVSEVYTRTHYKSIFRPDTGQYIGS